MLATFLGGIDLISSYKIYYLVNNQQKTFRSGDFAKI